jgi:hypothetical protein
MNVKFVNSYVSESDFFVTGSACFKPTQNLKNLVILYFSTVCNEDEVCKFHRERFIGSLFWRNRLRQRLFFGGEYQTLKQFQPTVSRLIGKGFGITEINVSTCSIVI